MLSRDRKTPMKSFPESTRVFEGKIYENQMNLPQQQGTSGSKKKNPN